MKKIISLLLLVCLIAGLGVNAVAYTGYLDVSDEKTSQNVDILSMMGIISGDGLGYFYPDENLTRAQFAKMSVEAMGMGEDEYLYRNRTIFPDVRSNHWARGYINLAVSLENKIISGTGNGSFDPDVSITYAQAVTMLMRMLGYADADAGMRWPQGYMELAAESGLTDGLNLQNNDPITRTHTAQLFVNLLNCDMKDGTAFLSSLGNTNIGTVIMSDNAKTASGKSGAVETSNGIYLPKDEIFPSSFVGQKGTIVTDESGFLLAFVPDSDNMVSIIASNVRADMIKASDGEEYEISSDIVTYDTESQSTYGEKWINIHSGSLVNLFFTDAGEIEEIFIKSGTSDDAMALYSGSGSSSFSSLYRGDSNVSMFKNGASATSADIRTYDVATYDKSSRSLYISDLKLSGTYENAYPNVESPSTITLMGIDFQVIPSAVDALSEFDIGDSITLLLTHDLRVAGAVDRGTVRTESVGIVTECTETSATIELLSGIEVQGDPQLDSDEATEMVGQLVNVSSKGKGKISLSALKSGSSSNSIDLNDRTIGNIKLSQDVNFFERVGNSGLIQIDEEDILLDTVRSSDVVFVSENYKNEAEIVVLDDVTGDVFMYGIVDEIETVESTSSFGPYDEKDPDANKVTIKYDTIKVENGDGSTGALRASYDGKEGDFVGIVPSLDGTRAAKIVELNAINNVERTEFSTEGDTVIATTSKGDFVVSDNVQCYNARTGLWMESLDLARSFSNDLTLYYDKDADDGGQIRVVVAN